MGKRTTLKPKTALANKERDITMKGITLKGNMTDGYVISEMRYNNVTKVYDNVKLHTYKNVTQADDRFNEIVSHRW